MKVSFNGYEYSYTVEPLNDEDRRRLWDNTKYDIKVHCIVFSAIAVIMAIPLFFLELDRTGLLKYLLAILCSLLIVLLLTALIMFVNMTIGLKSKYKIVEKGIVTGRDIGGGDSESVNYTYIGSNAYRSLPGNIAVGDRISIEHTLNKQNKKNLFIRVEKF